MDRIFPDPLKARRWHLRWPIRFVFVIEVVAAELDGGKTAVMIIVTTKAHTRQVRAMWNERSGSRRALRAILARLSTGDAQPAIVRRGARSLGLLNLGPGFLCTTQAGIKK
jgi:hypothetical protein